MTYAAPIDFDRPEVAFLPSYDVFKKCPRTLLVDQCSSNLSSDHFFIISFGVKQ